MLDNWIASAMRLRRDRRIDAQTVEMMRLVYTFGGLIARGLLSTDTRVSADFRVIAEICADTLSALPRTGAYAYTDAATKNIARTTQR
jgi:hypothetical protein